MMTLKQPTKSTGFTFPKSRISENISQVLGYIHLSPSSVILKWHDHLNILQAGKTKVCKIQFCVKRCGRDIRTLATVLTILLEQEQSLQKNTNMVLAVHSQIGHLRVRGNELQCWKATEEY